MNFSAKLLDGQTRTHADGEPLASLPWPEVTELTVYGVQVLADIPKGEQLRFFTRNVMAIGPARTGQLAIPVVELQKNAAMVCRLYCHPEKGPILSAQDLYFA